MYVRGFIVRDKENGHIFASMVGRGARAFGMDPVASSGMSERVKTSPGVAGVAAGAGQAPEAGRPGGDYQVLSEEVVGLLYEQAFGEHAPRTEREVCQAFSNILLRHCDL